MVLALLPVHGFIQDIGWISMLDIRFVRAHPDIIKADLTKRNDLEKEAWVDDLLRLDVRYRELIGLTNELRRRRNSISHDINRAKKAGADASALMAEAARLPGQIKENEAEMDEIAGKIRYYLMRLPNILHESVPIGKDDSENVEIKRYGTPRTVDFELKNHGQLALEKNWADFERATKTSGAGFYFLKGNLVLLDLALQRFSLDILMEKGYIPIMPPYMINRSSYEKVTDLADFEKVMYKIEDDDAYLIARVNIRWLQCTKMRSLKRRIFPSNLPDCLRVLGVRLDPMDLTQRVFSGCTSFTRWSSLSIVIRMIHGLSMKNCVRMQKRSFKNLRSHTEWSISALVISGLSQPRSMISRRGCLVKVHIARLSPAQIAQHIRLYD